MKTYWNKNFLPSEKRLRIETKFTPKQKKNNESEI